MTHPFINDALPDDPVEAYALLQRVVLEKTTAGDFWGAGGALELETVLINAGLESGRLKRREQYGSQRSSTYYAASGNALMRARYAHDPFTWAWWICRGVHALTMASWHSFRFRNRWKGELLMNVDQLDVRAAVLAKTFRRKQALFCVGLALAKKEKGELPVENEALLLSRKAQLVKDTGAAHKLHQEAYALTKVSPVTRVRVIRAYAAFMKKCGEDNEARKLTDAARSIATKSNLGDQALKIA